MFLIQLSCPGPQWKQRKLEFTSKRNGQYSVLRSVLDNKSSVNDNGATEPARILLERLFAQTQKLEEQIGRDPPLPQVAELGISLNKLEYDLQAALAVLKKKEEDLQDAERKVLLDYEELNHMKEELEQRAKEIAVASSRQEKLEEDLKRTNLTLASQAMVLEDLKLRLRDRDLGILAAQSALSLKEDEINKMRDDLSKKTKEAANIRLELISKSQHLEEVNEIVRRQEIELKELQRVIQEKEEEVEVITTLQKSEQEKLIATEANLKKQTMNWLVAQGELKKLAEEASKHSIEANQTLEDFRRVRNLLAEVRSELVSTQKALSSSRKNMEDQEQLLEKQLVELEAERESVISYTKTLEDAKLEVECERSKLRVAEARNKELERELSIEKELAQELQKELNKERSSLQEVLVEMSSLKEELDHENAKFEETMNLLNAKESELVTARLEIHQLKAEQASLERLLEEKDSELLNTQMRLNATNQAIATLKLLMNTKEDQLTEARNALKEKDENVQIMKHELDNTKLKFSEAESVVEQIVQFTKDLASSAEKECYTLNLLNDSGNRSLSLDSFERDKRQLQTELNFTMEKLKAKEMEVIAAQRALTIKDEEHKLVSRKLEAKEKEIQEIKKEMIQDGTELRQLYALVQEKIGEKTIGELATEKLQVEVAQLEVEAAITALHKLTEMSRDLLNKASLTIDVNYSENDDNLAEVKTEVAKLSTLIEQLVKEAGIRVS